MIYGIGIDITTIERFEKWTGDNSFCTKYFSVEEIEYINSRGKGATQSMAAGFAAKEAFGKALGTGLSGIVLKEITVLRDEKGKPGIKITESISNILKSCGPNPRVHLSISHESHLAVAQVIIEVDNV